MQDKAGQHWDLAAAGPDRAFSEKVARHSNSRGCTEKGELVASSLIRRGFAVAAAEDFSIRAERHDGLGRSWSWFCVVQIDSAALKLRLLARPHWVCGRLRLHKTRTTIQPPFIAQSHTCTEFMGEMLPQQGYP